MMLMNIFSSFDPSSFIFPLYLFPLFVGLMLQLAKVKILNFNKLIMKNIMKEVHPNLSSVNQKGSLEMFINMFFFFFILNLTGLLPLSFSLTSHISFNLPFSLFMWISFNIFSFNISIKKPFYHMVPVETPMILAPFMVMIELVSNIIRPITLSVRLMANMVAGHIMISLAESINSDTLVNKVPSFITMSLLMMLEIGVSFIQSYVFCILMSLYASENH